MTITRISISDPILDQGTAILFGDGAGCAILEPTSKGGILAQVAKTKHAPSDVLSIGNTIDAKKGP